jgi:CheY-like chemotaxis protein
VIEELSRLAEGVAAKSGAHSNPVAGSQPASDIMVVDDQPANLKLLDDWLTHRGHSVRSFPRGRLALDAAARHPPELILLDINMPEMNGFEVCGRLKADEILATIPVLFLSALNEERDKVQAFRSGGVDYVTKPFNLEEVQARVETHLALYRARRIERDLLEKTLNGAVKALADFVHMTSPALAERSSVLRSMIVHMAAEMHLNDRWQYELSAMLCLIGCITLPVEAFEHAYGGADASAEEMKMYRAHPEVGFRLLSRIPRLEIVAEMIRLQQAESTKSIQDQTVAKGVSMLRIAQELDRQMLRGIPFRNACDQLRSAPGKFPVAILDALKEYSLQIVQFGVQRVAAQQLLPGMILENDLRTRDGGVTVISKSATLTAPLIERVLNFAKTRGVREPILVRVPQSSCSGDSRILLSA